MRKLVALTIAGVLCMTGSAFANGYFLQLIAGPAPLVGQQVCTDIDNLSCNTAGADFSTVFLTAVVDCHKDQGFLGGFYGLTLPGTLVHTGFAPAPGFLQAPGTPPASTGATNTAGCTPCCSAIGSHSVLVITGAAPSTVSVANHADLGGIKVTTCDPQEVDAVCGGGATVNPIPGVVESICQCAGPTGVEASSWGSVKTLFD